MDIVVHGTKRGCKIFTPKKLPGLLNVTPDNSKAAAMGQQAYDIRFTADYAIFSKYKIIRDVRDNKRTGFVAFSLFLTNSEKLSGADIMTLLNQVSDEYCKRYVVDNNLDDVIEKWDFLERILGEYKTKLRTISFDNANALQSGSKDAAFIYFKDTDELQHYFDAPFQAEYGDYRQIFFVAEELRNKPQNPLNALRHSDCDLTGKIDLGKEIDEFKFVGDEIDKTSSITPEKEEYNRSEAVSYTPTTGNTILHSELKGTKKTPPLKPAGEKISGQNIGKEGAKKEPFYKKHRTILLIGFLLALVTTLLYVVPGSKPEQSKFTKNEIKDSTENNVNEDSIPIISIVDEVKPPIPNKDELKPPIPDKTPVPDKPAVDKDKPKKNIPETEILFYLKNSPELHIDTINKYLSVKGLSDTLSNSLKLYKEFWEIVQKDGSKKEIGDIEIKIIKDAVLKDNKNLTNFRKKIRTNEIYFEEYQKAANKQNIKTLSELERAMNISNRIENALQKDEERMKNNKIVEALKGGTLSEKRLMGFNSNDEKLNQSITLYLKFWILMNNVQKSFWDDFYKEIKQDNTLKDSNLSMFLREITQNSSHFKKFNDEVRPFITLNTTLQELIDMYNSKQE